ncbi:unnamed protein product [Mortierella alpina]
MLLSKAILMCTGALAHGCSLSPTGQQSITHALDLDSSSVARWLDSDAVDTHLATQQTAAEAGRHHDVNTNSFTDILFSRADVVAGLIVICIGMLVLIVAVAVYFTNGRSWKTLRKATSVEGPSNMVIEEDNSDLESNMQSKPEHHDAGPTGLSGTARDKETTTASEPSSASTARLEDPPSRSIFSFLKGNSTPRLPQTCTTHTTDEPSSTSSSAAALAKQMPQLTRTKARSSSEQNRSGSHARGLFSPRLKAGKKIKDSAAHPRRNGKRSSISIQIQDPDNVHVNNATTSPHLASSSSTSTSSVALSHPTRLQQLQQQQQEQLQQILTDGFSPNRPSRLSIGTTPTLLGLDMNSTSVTRSSSVMGLYGSARSSPNGSMVDAASTRAIYCASLKSAVSLVTTASQPLLLSGPCSEVMDADSKEIVQTTAVVTDADTGSPPTAEA